jgi:hypothetical protein
VDGIITGADKNVVLQLSLWCGFLYRVRSLHYWAKEFSSALQKTQRYSELPRTIVISILGYKQFDCKAFNSQFQILESTRHELLTNKMLLSYYELPKVPQVENADIKLCAGDDVLIPVPIANATNGRANAPIYGMLCYCFCTTAM